MKRVIVESPYAASEAMTVEQHVKYARLCMKDALSRGEAPIASHLIYTQPHVLDDAVPAERLLGIHAGFAWREVADLSAFYADFGWSRGMQEAFASAKKLGLKVEIRSLTELAVRECVGEREERTITHVFSPR